MIAPGPVQCWPNKVPLLLIKIAEGVKIKCSSDQSHQRIVWQQVRKRANNMGATNERIYCKS